jgi:RNA polymerase primary sigma factor
MSLPKESIVASRVVKDRRVRTGSRRAAPAANVPPLRSDELLDDAVLAADAANDRDEIDADEPDDQVEEDDTEISDAGEARVEAEAEAEPAPAAEPRRDEPSNFLSMYFRDMARLAVLRPQEEFESARALESLEVALWAQLLSFPPMAEHIMKVAERTLAENESREARPRVIAEFKTLRRALGDKKRLDRRERERYDRAVLRAAEKLRVLDDDRLAVEAAIRELKTIARGEPGRIVDDKVPVPVTSKPFRDYLTGVAGAFVRVQTSKNAFVKANLRLVVSIARRFNFGRMPLPDLIQEGNIGLIKAVERFDHRRGYRFSTYASWWIRHAISRALADKGRAVRLPVHMIDAYHRLGKARRELQAAYGRPPTDEEVAKKSGIPLHKLEKMKTYLTDQSVSLDRPINDEDGRTFIEFVQDPNDEGEQTDDVLVGETMTTEVRSQLMHLRPIEADILRQRFGFDTDEELTLKQIGEKYNLSRERIRQLQEQALEKMRRALARKDLM